jgi:hypothetical protein
MAACTVWACGQVLTPIIQTFILGGPVFEITAFTILVGCPIAASTIQTFLSRIMYIVAARTILHSGESRTPFTCTFPFAAQTIRVVRFHGDCAAFASMLHLGTMNYIYRPGKMNQL